MGFAFLFKTLIYIHEDHNIIITFLKQEKKHLVLFYFLQKKRKKLPSLKKNIFIGGLFCFEQFGINDDLNEQKHCYKHRGRQATLKFFFSQHMMCYKSVFLKMCRAGEQSVDVWTHIHRIKTLRGNYWAFRFSLPDFSTIWTFNFESLCVVFCFSWCVGWLVGVLAWWSVGLTHL